MDDGIRDRDRAPDGFAGADLVAVDGEDDRGEGQEDGHRVEIDRGFLSLCQAAERGDDESRDDRWRDQQKADVRRGRHVEVGECGLDVPGELAEEPGQRAERHEDGDPAVDAGRLASDQHGVQGREAAGGGPVGVLPQDDLATDVERREGHEGADDRQPDSKDDGLRSRIARPRPRASTARAFPSRGRHGRSRGFSGPVPLRSGAVHLRTVGDGGAHLHHRFGRSGIAHMPDVGSV